jgi:hypothetical protein
MQVRHLIKTHEMVLNYEDVLWCFISRGLLPQFDIINEKHKNIGLMVKLVEDEKIDDIYVFDSTKIDFEREILFKF